jgi:hypothetical protein
MIKVENRMQPRRNPKSLFLREVIPVPRSASPPIGNNMA